MVTPNNSISMTSAQKSAYVVARRADRIPMRVIAEELGVSTPRIAQIFKRAVDRVPADQVDLMRRQEGELADRAISNLLEIAENIKISPRTRVEAWSAIRSWSESKRKIFGVDSPVRREITIVTEETVDNAIRDLNTQIMIMEAQARDAGI